MGPGFHKFACGHAGPLALLAGALLAGLGTGLLGEVPAAQPNRIGLTVVDAEGNPIEQAIVWALPMSGQVLPQPENSVVQIEQSGKAFIPPVTPIRVGTSVNFPNLDTVRHHVYSFSAAKVFSLKLYIGTPAEPVVFDKPGEVVLGCNIHDGMLAYVLALETPYFGKTGVNGQVDLVDLAPGDYQLRAWHARQKAVPMAARITVREGDRLARRITADLSPRQAAAGI